MPDTDKSRELNLIAKWRRHPDLFVRQAVGVEPTTQQEEVLDFVGRLASAKHRAAKGQRLSEEDRALCGLIGIAIKSGRGAGKDAFLAWIMLWLLTVWPSLGEDAAKGLVTAPSAPQLSSVLWSELHKWINKSPILRGHLAWQSDKIYAKPNKAGCFVVARTANVKGTDEEHAETLAGLHSPYMIIAADEASALPKGVFSPLTGTLTGAVNFAILIGNPTRASGYFFECFNKSRIFWKCFTWNCEESSLVNKDSIELKARKWGRDSNIYRIEVLGEFPVTETYTLIPYEWVTTAVESEIRALENDPVLVGIDVGGGGDSTVMVSRQGNVVKDIDEFSSSDTMLIVGWIMGQLADMDRYDMAFIDPIGIGAGVYDRLRELNVGKLYPVDIRMESSNPVCFRLRDDLLWRLRGRFENRLIRIPEDEELIGELTTIKWDNMDNKGVIKIESKRDMRKRGLRSPNKLDALALTYYWGEDTLKVIGTEKGLQPKRRPPVNWKVV